MDITFKTEEGKFNYRVVAVIIWNNKLLVTHNNGAPYYCLPGGRVKMGETAEQAVLREVKEELDINAKIVRPLWLNQAFFKEDVDGSNFHELCLYFLMDISNSSIPKDESVFVTQEGDKTNTFEWLELEDVKTAYLYPTFLKDEIDHLPRHLKLRVERQNVKEKRGRISVKETQISEATQLWKIQKLAFAPLYEQYHDSGSPYLRGVDDVLNRLNTRRFRCFTIYDDDMIVGGILYRTSGSGVFFNSLQKGEYYLQRIYIHPDRQGEGIAQTAIPMCEKYFEDATAFVVDFPADIEKNKRCYEAAGFKDTGNREEVETGLTLAFYVKEVKKSN